MRRRLSEVEKVNREYSCTTCQAKPGAPCTDDSGASRPGAHPMRWQAAWDAGRFPLGPPCRCETIHGHCYVVRCPCMRHRGEVGYF